MNIQTRSAADPVASVLIREDLGHTAVLTLNRPAARNSLSEDLLRALTDAFASIAADKTVRAVVLAANGPAFCAGHDLKELAARRSDADGGRAYFRHIMISCSAVMQSIVDLPQPVIAAVHNVATAAGCQLVATCDLAIASTEATFATPGVNIGLFCSTPMVALSRNIPRKQAMEMLLTGEPISADAAQHMGLINHAVAPGTERGAAIELARKIAAKSAYTLKIGKKAFYRQIELGLADAYNYASEVMTENMMARDADEGICAFIEKRMPQWEDR
jgi:enoyl-CoA hydratase/carnithine racemase